MRTFFSMLGIVGALSTGLFASGAEAFSPASVPEVSHVTLVAGGCGIGLHRGPYGGCIPNGYGYGYGGAYRGGVYRGGVYRGGVYRGGAVYRGGYRAGYRHGYRHGFRR